MRDQKIKGKTLRNPFHLGKGDALGRKTGLEKPVWENRPLKAIPAQRTGFGQALLSGTSQPRGDQPPQEGEELGATAWASTCNCSTLRSCSFCR